MSKRYEALINELVKDEDHKAGLFADIAEDLAENRFNNKFTANEESIGMAKFMASRMEFGKSADIGDCFRAATTQMNMFYLMRQFAWVEVHPNRDDALIPIDSPLSKPVRVAVKEFAF